MSGADAEVPAQGAGGLMPDPDHPRPAALAAHRDLPPPQVDIAELMTRHAYPMTERGSVPALQSADCSISTRSATADCTDATTWAACLGRLGITPSDPPDQRWGGVRAMAVDGLYTIIEVLERHIS
jgi:hypothetical protein